MRERERERESLHILFRVIHSFVSFMLLLYICMIIYVTNNVFMICCSSVLFISFLFWTCAGIDPLVQNIRFKKLSRKSWVFNEFKQLAIFSTISHSFIFTSSSTNNSISSLYFRVSEWDHWQSLPKPRYTIFFFRIFCMLKCVINLISNS